MKVELTLHTKKARSNKKLGFPRKPLEACIQYSARFSARLPFFKRGHASIIEDHAVLEDLFMMVHRIAEWFVERFPATAQCIAVLRFVNESVLPNKLHSAADEQRSRTIQANILQHNDARLVLGFMYDASIRIFNNKATGRTMQTALICSFFISPSNSPDMFQTDLPL